METGVINTSETTVRKNQVLYDRFTSDSYRILYVPTLEDDTGYWIQTNTETNIPKPFQMEKIKEMLAMDILTVVADTGSEIPTDDELSPASARHRDKAWALISHIVGHEPEIYMRSARNNLLRNVETASGVKANNLYGYLGRYWRNGFRINALAPNYKNCGGLRTPLNGKSLGKPKRPGANGKTLTEEDYRNFEYAIKHIYKKGNGMSLHKTYDDMLARRYIKPKISADEKPVSLSPDEKPSFQQFYYWYRKNCNIADITKAREGGNKFELNHRAITGQTRTDLFGPGHSFQIDATIGDFYLVMESDRGRLIGRPIIVLVIDAWSDMVVGLSITLENSSCSVWKEALFNTGRSKVELCKDYGIDITEEEWPCHVLPLSITTDNGEFAVQAIDEIVRMLQITVENCPPYRGDLKGLIERALGTHQMVLKPYIPGHVDKDAGQRGAKDYRKESCVDFKSFAKAFILILLFHNNRHYMKAFPRTDDMRKQQIPSVPRDLWNYGIAHMSGVLSVVSPDVYLDVLLHKGTATVTGLGIRFNGLYYTCAEAEEEKWLECARIEGTYELPIRYTTSSCAHIYIKRSDGKYTTCSLVGACKQYRNSAAEEVRALHEQDLDMAASYTQTENQAYAELLDEIEKIVNRCKDEKKSGSTILDALHRHSIDENRQEEKKELSGENEARKMQAALGIESQMDSPVKTAENAKPKSFKAVSDEIDQILADLDSQT